MQSWSRPLLACVVLLMAARSNSGDATELHTIDRVVPHVSTAPANRGEAVGLFLREKIGADLRARLDRGASAEGHVVLLVHGGITPSEPAFDLPWRDYSWMDHLAEAGFDVFAMDFTGYGRSPRPAMDDPCNLSAPEQLRLIPEVLDAPCEPSYAGPVTTRESDWDELEAVVDHIRTLRGVERVSLLGWSLGGVRAGGYAARHPERVDRLVLYSPAYSPTGPGRPRPPTRPVRLIGYDMLSDGRWQRAVACDAQVDPGIRPVIWRTLMEADPIGAAWAPPQGVKRQRTSVPAVEGAIAWDANGAARIRAPTLILAGEQDNPQRKRRLFEDMTGTEHRVLAIMECATHYAVWERTQYRFLHAASVEWLRSGTLRGRTSGVLRIPAQD